MRTTTFDAISSSHGDDFLTTGEAAKILNSSRQHVADMCDRGDLPFTTVGVHRRVQRSDIEIVRARTQRLTRDQRRSLWLGFAVAGKIVADPNQAKLLANRNLKQMRQVNRGQTLRWLDEWGVLLDGPIDKILEMLTSRTPKGREMRQNSPFRGVLTEPERTHALETWSSQT